MYTLRSKYSIRLYELIERRIKMERQGEYFTPEQLRDLLGVPKGKLKRFADFNKHCLKPAVAEVNEITDFMVAIGAIKKGRSIHKLAHTREQEYWPVSPSLPALSGRRGVRRGTGTTSSPQRC